MAEFREGHSFPEKPVISKDTHLFIADTPTGPALQFAEATAYSSGNDYARVGEEIACRDHHRP